MSLSHLTPAAHEVQERLSAWTEDMGCPKACHKNHAALCLLQRAGRMCAGGLATPASNVTARYQQHIVPPPAAGLQGAALQLAWWEALASALHEKERFPTAG